jgi:hypothetical protein
MRQRYVRLIENGQRLGDGFFEVLQDRFQGNFGGIGEQLVKVVFNFAMRFVPHVVCETKYQWFLGKIRCERSLFCK